MRLLNSQDTLLFVFFIYLYSFLHVCTSASVTCSGPQSFSVSGPTLCNSIPFVVKETASSS